MDNINSELIFIFKTYEFNEQLNIAFHQGIFAYVNNRFVYVPYEEEVANLDLNFNKIIDELISMRLQRNIFQRAQASMHTRWFWFETYRAEFNNEATQILTTSLTIINTVSGIMAKFIKLIPIVGTIVSRIIRVIVHYLTIMKVRFIIANRGNGVYFWVTMLIVWYDRPL